MGAIRGVVDDSLDDSASASRGDGRLPAEALVGVVVALARALTLAAEVGRWEIVAQLAEELAARHGVREGAVAHGEKTPALWPPRAR